MDEFRNKQIEDIGALLLRYREQLVGYCANRMHGDIEDVRDLMQTVTLAALIRRDELSECDTEDKRLHWLMTVARSEASRYNRQKRLSIIHIGSIENRYAAFLSHADTEDSLGAELLEHARESLRPDEVEIVRLRIEGYTLKEIAHSIGKTHGAVRKQMKRIIDKMRTHYNLNNIEQ